MKMLTDSDLIRQYFEGDEAALRELLGRYASQVYHFAARYVGPGGNAEDIAQDALVSVWKNLKKFEHDKKFSTWLLRSQKMRL